MAAVLEMIGAFVIASILSLMVLQLQINAYQTDVNAKYTYILQSHSNVFRQELVNTIKVTGYNLTDIENLFLRSEPNAVTFLTDLDDDGLADTVSIVYKDYTTDPTPLNPLDKGVYIIRNGAEQQMDIYGIYNFRFTYYNGNNEVAATAANIRFVSFSYEMLSREPLSPDKSNTDPTNYAMTVVDERVFLKNVWDW